MKLDASKIEMVSLKCRMDITSALTDYYNNRANSIPTTSADYNTRIQSVLNEKDSEIEKINSLPLHAIASRYKRPIKNLQWIWKTTESHLLLINNDYESIIKKHIKSETPFTHMKKIMEYIIDDFFNAKEEERQAFLYSIENIINDAWYCVVKESFESGIMLLNKKLLCRYFSPTLTRRGEITKNIPFNGVKILKFSSKKRFNYKASKVDYTLLSKQKKNRNSLKKFKTSLNDILSPFRKRGIILSSPAKMNDIKSLLFYPCDSPFFKNKEFRSDNPKTANNIKNINLNKDNISISLDKLKPSLSDWNKPILNREQINVMFNILKDCNIINKDIQRKSLDTSISLLTGYSEKQIHKGSNTPTNQIINDKSKITDIQNALKSVIDKLEEEKRSIL